MPRDAQGKHHPNSQLAAHADRMGAAKKAPKPAPGPMEGSMDPMAEHDGDENGEVTAHLSAMHAKDGEKHMHVSSDGMGGFKSHHVSEDGEVQGPHEHEDIEGLKSHMEQVMGDGQGEYGGHQAKHDAKAMFDGNHFSGV